MNKLSTLIILCSFLVHGNLFSQSSWENVPQAVQFSPTEIQFTDLNNGWATTVAGNIARTTDGGNSWTLQEAFFTNSVYGIEMISTTHGYAGGPFSILETNDGENWDTIVYDSNSLFGKMDFLNDTVGIAYSSGSAGELILKTTDGGQSWDTIFSELNFIINEFQFLNDSTIIVVGPDLNPSMNLAISHDGGATWNQSQITGIDILDVAFTSTLIGHATGQNGVYMRTQDGGLSWETSVYDQIWYPYPSVYFQSEMLGFIGMENGGMLRTSDGGENWTEVLPPANRNFSKIQFIDALHGWAASSILTEIITTSDGGLTWTSLYSGSGWGLTDIAFSSETEGWACGLMGTVLHTTNSGNTWSLVESPIQHNYGKIEIADQTIWVIANDWAFFTFNNGVNWYLDQFPNTVLSDIDFPTPDTGYMAAGMQLLKTIDGGNNWSYYYQFQNFSYVSFADANTGLAANQDAIFRTADGGENWETITPQGAGGHRAIDYPAPDTAYIVGFGGLITATYDGGTTWIVQNSGTTSDLTNVSFTSATTGWASGNDGTILMTQDAGFTWLPQSTPSQTQITAVTSTPGNVGWASKMDGNFLKFNCSPEDSVEVNTFTLSPAGTCNGSVTLSSASGEAFVTNVSGQSEVVGSTADFSDFCEGMYVLSGYNSCGSGLNGRFVIPDPGHFFGASLFTDSVIISHIGNVQELCSGQLSSVSSARLIEANNTSPLIVQAQWEITTSSGIVEIPAFYAVNGNGVYAIQLSLYCEENGFEGVVINENIFVDNGNTSLNNTVLKSDNLTIFPNPTSDEITIRFEDNNAALTIRDINGKALLSKTVSSNEQIDLSGFADGVYLFEIVTDKARTIKRIVKN